MDEKRKTALLWVASLSVFFVCAWLVLLYTPPLFTVSVEEGAALTDSGERVKQFLEQFGKTDLNTLDADGLLMLPQMEEELARFIVHERDKRHGFSSVDDLLCVEGVTEEQVALWKDLLYCG